ncbi:MAG TPA: hypothetical protein VD906_05805, partial [Caulobacteraceae bacterium]|nr:hypothetical protein [Caulobacteraceae bacterium]
MVATANHENIGGNTMSLKTRLALMAGSSLAAASLSAATSLVVVLLPTSAAAQAVPGVCSPDPATVAASGPGPDNVTCLAQQNPIAQPAPQTPIPPYPAGIAYSSNGDLTVTMVANGAVVNTTVGVSGVDLIGNGGDNVTWNSSVGALIGSAGAAGPLLDVTTNLGDISITTGAVLATQAGKTHAIRATSTGAGDITITRNGAVSNNVAGGQAAIQAVTNGGDISITAAGQGNTQGRLRGIVAQTSGVGVINISTSNSVSVSTVDGVAAIDTIAGTGPTTISITGASVSGGAGLAIRSVSSGTVAIQQSTTAFTTIAGRVDFSGAAGGVTWNSGNGTWNASGASTFSAAADTVNFGSGSLNGSIDFGAGADTFNQLPGTGAFTATNSTLDFGAGADHLNISGRLNAVNTPINFGADGDTLSVSGSLDLTNAPLNFGAGADTIALDGILSVNGSALVNDLEVFNSGGTILLGGGSGGVTDGAANDILRLTSGVFTGSGDSRVRLDAF